MSVVNMAEQQSLKPRLVRIIPPRSKGNGATLTQGTKLVTSSGEKIPGVYKVEIEAAVGSVWRAAVHLNIDPTGLEGVGLLAQFHYPAKMPWYKRMICRAIGIKTHDVTALADTEARSTRL